jgi:pimeloyl-ACP methyl ester carboxylesterase
MQMKLDGGAIAYDYIQGQDGQPPVVFLHSALGVRSQFDALRAQLPERAQLAPDFPGHGHSAVTGGMVNSERMARDMLALIDSLETGPVDIIGHSMGGYVGLVMAHLAPERIHKIVTLGTKFYWTEEVIEKTRDELDGAVMKEKAQRHYDALARLHAEVGIDDTLRHTQSLIADFARWQVTEEMVRGCGVPLMVCAGDRDSLVPAAEVMRLFGALEGKRNAVAILPGTPHPLQHVPVECFAQMVRRFWAMP